MNKQMIPMLIMGLFLSTQVHLFGQNGFQIINHDWIAVKSGPYKKEKWASPIEGIIYSFTSNKLLLRNIFIDTTRIYNYRVKKNKLILNDSIKIKIDFISNDSLKLVFDKGGVITFLPLKKQQEALNITNSDFTENNWTMHYEYNQLRIDFLNKDWEDLAKYIPKICITHQKIDEYCDQNLEKWSYSLVDDYHLLTITWRQLDPFTYQVLRQNYDTIFTRLLYPGEPQYPFLVKHPKSGETEKQKISDRLSARKWNTIQIVDSTKVYEGFYVDDNDVNLYNLISEKDFLEKKLAFVFDKKDGYKILVNNQLFKSGQWKLSVDGRYVILDEGVRPEDYIEIIEANSKSIVIAKSDQFRVGNLNEYYGYYYKLKLE